LIQLKKILHRIPFINIILHLSIWGLFFTLIFFTNNEEHPVELPTTIVPLSLRSISFIVMLLGTMFYWNYLFLVPKIYFHKGIKYYLFSLLLTFLAFSYTANWVTYYLFSIENKDIIPFIAPLPPFLLITMIGLTLRLIGDKRRKEKEIAERETENLKSELSFLRSQISPHFLFNVMNNVVSLARLQPQKVEPTLIKLSSLMRYMLYESDEKKVEIRKEVEYLQAYIDLQALRFDDDVKVAFEHDIQENILIEPMLFIPFVENAFKHGVGLIEHPEINISIKNKDKVLIFKCLNKYKNNQNNIKDDASGIGLRNVQRRLELLYPEQHDLKIVENGDWFDVSLEIYFKNIEKIA
jgi:two-component system, LytTR family, sensor kinase